MPHNQIWTLSHGVVRTTEITDGAQTGVSLEGGHHGQKQLRHLKSFLYNDIDKFNDTIMFKDIFYAGEVGVSRPQGL